jgi:hypothetical protein
MTSQDSLSLSHPHPDLGYPLLSQDGSLVVTRKLALQPSSDAFAPFLRRQLVAPTAVMSNVTDFLARSVGINEEDAAAYALRLFQAGCEEVAHLPAALETLDLR